FARLGLGAALVGLCTVSDLGAWALWPALWMLAGLIGLARSRAWKAGRAYVITNQRCFQLVLAGGRLVVREVPPTVHDRRLDPQDRKALEERVKALGAAGNAARRRSPEERRGARDLPPRLRQAGAAR